MEKDAPKGSIVGTLITVALVLCAVLLIYRFANWPLLLSLDFGVLWQYRGVLMSGLGTTFLITAVSGVVGLGVGTVLAVASQSHFWPLRWAIVAYVEIWRNTPLLVQVVWIHFALPLVTGYSTSALQSGLLAISLQASAYFSEIMRGGIEAVPKGQLDAAHALGLSAWTRWTRVILPPAVRAMVPALANLGINFFKTTAILSAVQVAEVMTVATRISNHTFRHIELITFVAAAFFLVGNVLNAGAAWLERRFARADG